MPTRQPRFAGTDQADPGGGSLALVFRALRTRLAVTVAASAGLEFSPEAKNGTKALYIMVLRPKSLKIWVLRALG